MIKKIAILGPESTGKSTLCKQLAEHFNSIWTAEYAREYLTANGSDYTYDDLLKIAIGQVALEEQSLSLLNNSDCNNLNSFCSLFIDTEMYVMKVWCEYVFNNCHRYILDQIASRNYDLYLLCKNDLPWYPDELREYPDPAKRNELFLIYKDIMTNQHVPWIEISGDYDQRLEIAITAVNQLQPQ
jgi:NadR type nicotinamide-nucleotide adenylyltransferase